MSPIEVISLEVVDVLVFEIQLVHLGKNIKLVVDHYRHFSLLSSSFDEVLQCVIVAYHYDVIGNAAFNILRFLLIPKLVLHLLQMIPVVIELRY